MSLNERDESLLDSFILQILKELLGFVSVLEHLLSGPTRVVHPIPKFHNGLDLMIIEPALEPGHWVGHIFQQMRGHGSGLIAVYSLKQGRLHLRTHALISELRA